MRAIGGEELLKWEKMEGVSGCEGKILVLVRLRPLSEKETAANESADWECINDTTILYWNTLREGSTFPSAYTFAGALAIQQSSNQDTSLSSCSPHKAQYSTQHLCTLEEPLDMKIQHMFNMGRALQILRLRYQEKGGTIHILHRGRSHREGGLLSSPFPSHLQPHLQPSTFTLHFHRHHPSSNSLHL